MNKHFDKPSGRDVTEVTEHINYIITRFSTLFFFLNGGILLHHMMHTTILLQSLSIVGITSHGSHKADTKNHRKKEKNNA
jgi:hypothetical protein